MALRKTYNKFGFLKTVSNPKGTKAPVTVAERINDSRGRMVKSNYTAYNKKRTVGYGKSAEKLAERLAKKGHKRATILD